MPPLVLALIDSVFALALHHQGRAQRSQLLDHASASVRAKLAGPESEGPFPGGLRFDLEVELVPREGEGEPAGHKVHFHVDLEEGRLLAADLALAELPLDRSGLARLIGELESWCYDKIRVQKIEQA